MSNGDTVLVRHTTADTNTTATTTVLTIESISADFISTTKAVVVDGPSNDSSGSSSGGGALSFDWLFLFSSFIVIRYLVVKTIINSNRKSFKLYLSK